VSYYNRARSFRYAHAYGNAGNQDVAYMYDQADAADLFRTWGHQSVFSGGEYYNRTRSFAKVYAYATPGFGDVAKFYLTEGKDELFEVWPDHGVLNGSGYDVEAWDFAKYEAYGNPGDMDEALLHDAALTVDYLEAISNWAELTAGDDSFSYYVEDFPDVTAFSTTPGGDIRNVGALTFNLHYDGTWIDL
jgi:hypothetical protein